MLTIHSWLRWLVLVLAVVATARAFIGWLGKKDWTALDNRLGLFLSSSVDAQLLVGLILYVFLSPLTKTAFQDFGAAMANDVWRYWGVEHIALMVAGLVLVHVGGALSKRAEGAVVKHRRVAIFFGLALLAILIAIPWPFFASYGRSLFRLG